MRRITCSRRTARTVRTEEKQMRFCLNAPSTILAGGCWQVVGQTKSIFFLASLEGIKKYKMITLLYNSNTETITKEKRKKKRAVSTKLPRSKMSEPGRSSHIHSLGTGYLYTFTSSPSSLSSGFSLYAASRTVQPHTEERGSVDVNRHE
jgi:hypothetical protein